MLSLVNYGSSGESEEEDNSDNGPDNPSKSALNAIKKSEENEKSKFNNEEWSGNSSNEITVSKQTSESTKQSEESIDRDVDSVNSPDQSKDRDNIMSKLPPPVSDLRSIPWDQLSKLTYKSKAIRIMAPSIPEEIEEKKEKKQPSKTGSGLLSMLPKPRNEFVAKPHSLKPTSMRKPPAPVKPKLIPKPKFTSPVKAVEEHQSDSDGEDDDTDFFSLSTTTLPVVTNSDSNTSDIPLTSDIPIPPSSIPVTSDIPIPPSNIPFTSDIPIPPDHCSVSSSSHRTTTVSSRGSDNSSFYIDTIGSQDTDHSSSSSDYVSFQQTNDELHLNQEALAALCGSRGLKRRAANEDEFKIIDISGSELTPDSQELLTKNLTGEQPRASHRNNKDGPTSQQKRKHQIIYLAHQAKEQELELQNTWANNRMTKKQTQAKYGF